MPLTTREFRDKNCVTWNRTSSKGVKNLLSAFVFGLNKFRYRQKDKRLLIGCELRKDRRTRCVLQLWRWDTLCTVAHLHFPIWEEFNKSCLHTVRLRVCNLVEYRSRDACTFLLSVNKIIFVLLPWKCVIFRSSSLCVTSRSTQLAVLLTTSWDAKIPSAITEITRLKASRHVLNSLEGCWKLALQKPIEIH